MITYTLVIQRRAQKELAQLPAVLTNEFVTLFAPWLVNHARLVILN